MTDDPKIGHRWLLVRQGPLAAEEQSVLDSVRRRLSADRRELVTVLLGTASYGVESPAPGPNGPGEQWLLEEDAQGRGIRRPKGASVNSVTADELVAAIMTAEKVIQFP